MSQTIIELSYAATTLLFIIAGLTMVGKAGRAYMDTGHRAMLHLSIGFTLAVAGAAATIISAFMTGFQSPRTLLLVNSSLFTLGFVFIIYSIIAYD